MAGISPDEMLQSVASQPDNPDEMSWGETGVDVAKSAAIGVPKGVIAGAGFPGAVRDMASKATDWFGEKFELDPERLEKMKGTLETTFKYAPNPLMQLIARGYTPEQIQKFVEQYTGEFYKPKTAPGKIAETAIEFAANPMSYLGPGSAALKGATALAAGAGSEAAGQATEAVGGEGPLSAGARIAGAVIAGKMPHAAAQQRFRGIIRGAKSTDELFDTADALYDASRTTGVMLKPGALAKLQADIFNSLQAEGFRQRNIKAAWDAIEELGQATNNIGLTGVADVQSVSKVLNKVANSAPENAAQNREAARFAIAEINKYMASVPASDIAVGTPKMVQEAVKSWREADRAYAAGMRAEQLELALTHALDRAGSTGKGQNVENAMRQNIRAILDSKIKSRGFTSSELSKMREIVRGATKNNVLRGLGSLAPTGIVSGTLGLELASMLFKGPAMFGVPLAGYVAKKASDSATATKVHDLIAGVRYRGTGTPPPAPPKHMPMGSLSTFMAYPPTIEEEP